MGYFINKYIPDCVFLHCLIMYSAIHFAYLLRKTEVKSLFKVFTIK